MSSMNIICLESEAFYTLVDRIVEHLKGKHEPKEKWIDDVEAMRIMKIASKTTLQKYRDEGKIRFSQIAKKIILYDRESILAFIESKAKDTF